ncbi:hypothetical protein [Alteraurantiacibacter palmitatis]|uniref:DUF4345 domain-containing protein n=1 Tax=Alteraurantiacibacter palmitatis TaxID=2054628 RepID=A0ABV7E6M4_9SPHN
MGSDKAPLVGALVLVLGVLTLGTGIYFLWLRPPLLPEDILFIGVAPEVLPPPLLDWLGIVFRTWGGFVAGFGALLMGIGTFMLTGRARWLYWATALGILAAFGRFLISNIVLRSDFLWFIAAIFLLAAAAAVLLASKGRR